MPPAYTPAQKSAIAQFVSFTQAKDSIAARHLKSHGWNVEQSVDSFFQSSNISSGGSAQTAALNKMFDKYRDDPQESPDAIGVEGSMQYLGDLGVGLDEVVVLAVLAELEAPTMGEFTRDGFLTGWKNYSADTLQKQQSTITQFRHLLSTNPDFFKRVYRHTFLVARTPGQKGLQLDAAIEYWRLLFTSPSVSWNSPSTPWLEFWIEYLEEKWKKSVNRDMWDQTLVFARKCLGDETMSWWSEDGAWPGVLDEFVVFVKGKREGDGGEKMEE